MLLGKFYSSQMFLDTQPLPGTSLLLSADDSESTCRVLPAKDVQRESFQFAIAAAHQ